MYQNTSGQSLDYETFKSEFDTNPQIKNLVDRFDGKGIVLKTKEKKQSTEFGKKPGIDKAAANRAAANVLQQPG